MYYVAFDMTITPPSRSQGLVTVQLGTDLKAAFQQWCASQRVTPSKALRSLVERALAEGEGAAAAAPPAAPVRFQLGSGGESGQRRGREIYFNASEHEAIELAAAAEGFGFHEWVIAAVRAALAQVPAYGQAELQALVQSNAGLAQAIVQIKAIRGELGEADLAERIHQLERDLRQHVEAVSRVMAQGAHRWQIKI